MKKKFRAVLSLLFLARHLQKKKIFFVRLLAVDSVSHRVEAL